MKRTNERSRWRLQKNDLPQGSVLSPTLFNIYNNDQAVHDVTRSVSYADDLYITAHPTFSQVESTIEEALGELTKYYGNNSLRANPDKTQVTAFHQRNREAKRSLKVSWNGVDLENTTHPKCFGVTRRQDVELQRELTEHQDECIYSSKRHSLQAVELSQRTQSAVQIVSNHPRPAMGARFTVFWACQPYGPAGWLALLLTKAGDVETNPGPTTINKKVWICDISHKQIHVRKQHLSQACHLY